MKKTVASSILGAAIALIGYYEGYKPKAYLDPINIPTICYGHTGKDVFIGLTKTKTECDELLSDDVKIAQKAVERLYRGVDPLPDETAAAMISFTYNMGQGALATSTMLKKLNAGDLVGACNELPRWINAGQGINKKPLQGLINRREAEKELCLKGAMK
ncbi:lysozyme [Iodobacter sp.]|uniref:lysozyme n=1 Tax=Iodobacter sp. TaxID=1915058 RepID=UPI0025E6DB68|nr:lysozyme [Iodobacter sp.]